MGKLKEFEITLNDNKKVYSPGESITGNVKISTDQPVQCKAIKVNCQGYCGVTSRANDTTWAEEEQYFSSTVSVADKGTLKEGQYTFPFKFLLPAAAPMSFEGPYGRIMYRVRSFIDTPRFAKDYKTEKHFYMLNNVDLNQVPDIYKSNSLSVTKNFSYMLVKNGTLVLTVKTDLRGYTAGQVIKVFTEIDNKSDKSTSHVVASLIQKVTYNTKKPTHDQKTLASVEGPEVKGGKQAEWKEQIIVPRLPQSPLNGCTLIEISYFIHVSLKFPGVSLTLPVHIGSVAVDPSKRLSSKPLPSTPEPSKPQSSAPEQAQPELTAPEPSRPQLSVPEPSKPLHSAPEPSKPLPPVPTPRVSSPASSDSPSSDASRSASLTRPPPTAPRPAPRPRPRSAYVIPSAPPAEPDVMMEGGHHNEEIPNKAPEAVPSPNAFSYAPGLMFPHNTSHTSVPHVPSIYPVLHPPDYRGPGYPQEPPPSYEDSIPNT